MAVEIVAYFMVLFWNSETLKIGVHTINLHVYFMGAKLGLLHVRKSITYRCLKIKFSEKYVFGPNKDPVSNLVYHTKDNSRLIEVT
jgi:hypothetical protein